MDRRSFEVTVLAREARDVGLFFKERRYFVTFEFTETGVIHERWVSPEQYWDYEVGSKYNIVMYRSPRRDLWCFSAEEASE